MSNPNPVLVETYKGIDIYQDVEAQTFFFYYQEQLYANLQSQFTAEAQIDILLEGATTPQNLEDFMPPTSEARTPIAYYKGVPLFQIEWGYMGGGTGYESWFYWKGNKQATSAPYFHLYPLIDDLLLLEVEEEEIPVVPPVLPPVIEPPVVAPTGFSWLWGWIENLKVWFGGIGTSITGAINGIGSSISGIGTAIQGGFASIGSSISGIGIAIGGLGKGVSDALFGGIKSTSDGLTEPLRNLGQSTAEEVATAMSQHSPDPQLKAKVDEMITSLMASQKEIIDTIHKSPADIGGSLNASGVLAASLVATELTVEVAGAVLDILHPIKKVGAQRLSERLIDNLAVGTTLSKVLGMASEIGLLTPLNYYYNSIYQPSIPPYQDLVNMRVKEKIDQPEFEKNLAYQGFSSYFAGKIWDAHFVPPTLTDYLTAWRRGVISEDEVDQGMVRIDLDPEFKKVFDTRKFVDPPLAMIRFMFETGSIIKEQVKPLVHLIGYRPEHEEAITNYITEFQSRLWRRRYLVSLAGGYEKGIISKEELQNAVIQAEYTPEVANYIILNADTRKRIAESKITTIESKLLAITDLKKAYANNIISVDQLRTELMIRKYAETEIDTLIKIMDLDKLDVDRGKRVVALSVAEMKDAYKTGVWTEDKLRMELQLRGLGLDEVDTIINTLKVKIGMAEEQA